MMKRTRKEHRNGTVGVGSRSRVDRRVFSETMILSGNRFIVAQIHRGAERLSSRLTERSRYFVSSFAPVSHFSPPTTPREIVYPLPSAFLVSFIPLSSCSPSSFPWSGIEVKLLLMLARTAPSTTDAVASERAQSRSECERSNLQARIHARI